MNGALLKNAMVSIVMVTATFAFSQDTALLSHVHKIYTLRYKNPALIDSSIVLINKYLTTYPDNIEARVLLSEIYLKKGNQETDTKTKLGWFTKGNEQAQRALLRDSLNGRALTWEVSNFSMICKTKGIMSSLANIPRIKQGIARALQLDPSFPKAYAAQGIIYMELPSFLGGNLDSARYYYQKGLALDPNYAGIYIRMAEMHVLKKEYPEAREILNKVTIMKDPTDRAEYELVNKPEAEKLLEKIKDK